MERGFNYGKKPCGSEEGTGYNPDLELIQESEFAKCSTYTTENPLRVL